MKHFSIYLLLFFMSDLTYAYTADCETDNGRYFSINVQDKVLTVDNKYKHFYQGKTWTGWYEYANSKYIYKTGTFKDGGFPIEVINSRDQSSDGTCRFTVLSQEGEFSITPITDGTEFKCALTHFWKVGIKSFKELPLELSEPIILTFDERMKVLVNEKEKSVGIEIYSYAEVIELEKRWMHLNKGDKGISYINKDGPLTLTTLHVFENGKIVKTISGDGLIKNTFFFIGECSRLSLKIKRESYD